MQCVMSLIGCHYTKKVALKRFKKKERKGLFYKDFFLSNNFLYVLHENLISQYNIITNQTMHFSLGDFYDNEF